MSVKDFAAFKQAGPQLVGQPFQLHAVMIPASASLTCNCGGEDTAVEIKMSVQAHCASCGRGFNCAYNPTTNKIEFQIAVPQETKPS